MFAKLFKALRPKKKEHFYCFSFSSDDCYKSANFSLEHKWINRATLKGVAKHFGMGENYVVISISYLGYMTEEQFHAGCETEKEEKQEA